LCTFFDEDLAHERAGDLKGIPLNLGMKVQGAEDACAVFKLVVHPRMPLKGQKNPRLSVMLFNLVQRPVVFPYMMPLSSTRTSAWPCVRGKKSSTTPWARFLRPKEGRLAVTALTSLLGRPRF
jgi:hypothetical protein